MKHLCYLFSQGLAQNDSLVQIYYRLQRSWGKVMFLRDSVHRGGGGAIPACLAAGLQGGGCLVMGAAWWRPPGRLLLRPVRILLECILVVAKNISRLRNVQQ